jgi:uncharacterized membrane protein YbhN (UPF0104 family)
LAKLKKYGWVLLKITLSVLGFWFAFHSVEDLNLKEVLQGSNLILIFIAGLTYIGSQVVSSFRLKYVLTALEDDVPTVWNLKLYFQGMAYNLFLPGGIGGDAYKMIAYGKRASKPTKQYFLPLLADRLLGLGAIVILLGFYIPFVPDIETFEWMKFVAVPAPIVLVGIGYFVVNKWFSLYTPKIWIGLAFSVGIQLLQVLSILCILFSLQNESPNDSIVPLTVFVFLLSSIATAIPVFMGGLGAREVVFAIVFVVVGQTAETGVWVALVFSTIVVLSSLPGLLMGFYKD